MATESKVRNAVFCGLAAVTLALLAGSLSPSWRAIAQGLNATAEQPARIPVAVPQGAGPTLLVSVKAFRKPTNGHIGGIVRLKRPGVGSGIVVGRFSVMPAESFTAASSADEKRYQFDVTSAVSELRLSGADAEVEVALFDRSGGPTPIGAELTVGTARITTR
jgi:hypothetical protein